MIDHNLIEQSTQYSINQINKIISTECSYIFLLENFLNPVLLEKLIYYLTNTTNWIPQENYNGGILENRLKINWEADSVIEETHIVLANLTDTINKLFNRNNKFLGINLWKDTTGYNIIKHVDNPQIDIAIQLYLNSNASELGTQFEYNNKIIKTPYLQNCGYLLDNHGQVVHYFNSAIPNDYSRYSLYAVWTDSTK